MKSKGLEAKVMWDQSWSRRSTCVYQMDAVELRRSPFPNRNVSKYVHQDGKPPPPLETCVRISQRREPTDVLCHTSHHPLLTALGSVRTPQPISKQAEPSSPFRQTGSPLTICTVLVSLLNNKITSRIIQLFCSQAENAQTAVRMRMPFPPGKQHFHVTIDKYLAIKAII